MSSSSPPASSRHLAAVWFADVVGYTARAAEDEAAALGLIAQFQEHCHRIVQEHGGRLVKFTGDGAIAEFLSTETAGRSALALVRSFRAATGCALHIGIHVGDIVVSPDGDVYGDGVNTAARLQQIAEAGQVLVSEDVHRQLRPQAAFRLEPRGRYEPKGSRGAVRLYELSYRGSTDRGHSLISPPSRSALFWSTLFAAGGLLAFATGGYVLVRNTGTTADGEAVGVPAEVNSLPIAVLPFDNLSADSSSEYFADGITGDILASVSRIRGVHVISRTSVMQYKGSTKRIPEIAAELGVVYVLEGTVRRDGDQIRVTAQLIDAGEDRHVWAHVYDRELEGVFQIQSEIAQQVALQLQATLTPADRSRIAAGGTSSSSAYDLHLKGREYLWRPGGERSDTDAALRLFQTAIEEDPGYAAAWAGASLALQRSLLPLQQVRDSSMALARRAVALDPNSAEPRIALAGALAISGEWDASEAEFRKALAFDPSNADAGGGSPPCCSSRGSSGTRCACMSVQRVWIP